MTRNIALDIDEFHFSFCGVLDAYVFDEKQKSSQHFHGMPMKAVDIFLETDDKFVFIEVKAFPADLALEYSHSLFSDHECVNHLKNSLKYKFRDSYLYKHAEGTSFNKDVHYLCLLTFDTPINQFLSNCLRVELPIQRGPRWVQSLATSVHVLNLKMWNKVFPKWPVSLTLSS